MAERSRRIALLGPEEVTRAADQLTETMQSDVAVTTKFFEVVQVTVAATDSSPRPEDAFEQTTNEFVRRTEAVTALLQANSGQGGSLRDLDGHPKLVEAMRTGQLYRRASEEALQALRVDAQQLADAAEHAATVVSTLTKNKAARELSRTRFTVAVQRALGTPPTTAENPATW